MISVQVQNITCRGTSGSVKLMLEGGVSPFKYLFRNTKRVRNNKVYQFDYHRVSLIPDQINEEQTSSGFIFEKNYLLDKFIAAPADLIV